MGTTYTGSRVNGKLEGSGKAVYAEGDTYEGEFVSGYRQGKGEYHWVDGDRYVGSWDNGVISGYGVYWWTSGNRYVGYWENNMKNGIDHDLIISQKAVNISITLTTLPFFMDCINLLFRYSPFF